jgi:diguanylate cyclase (GGDEF)-like protein
VLLTLGPIAAILVCSIHAAVAPADTQRAAGIGYLVLTIVLFASAVAFWTRARSAQNTLYMRWSLVAAGALCASVGYAPSFAEGFLGKGPVRFFQTACFNASEALYMLAAVLFFAGVARSIVIIDMLQALLFVVVRFNLIYSRTSLDHFSTNHLLIGQLMALFLLVIATVACLGATSRAELRFLQTLSCFLGIRLIGFFLANQVSYLWLHYLNCSIWDVPGPALTSCFALYLLYTEHSTSATALASVPLGSPGVAVRSLLPSFLALVNLVLGLFLLRVSVPLASIAISMSLVCYVVRTVLLHAQSVNDKSRLETRNEQLEGLAVRDPLTGIGNRRSLAGLYGKLQASVGSGSLSILLIDIDYFKQANDSHGHQHGDRVLVSLAKRLERIAANLPGSHAARLGGDEFALLLMGVFPQNASDIAEDLRVFFHEQAFEAETASVSLSIGVASLQTAHDLRLETLICHADEALYRAKLMGRNRVESQPVWDPATPCALNLQLEFQRLSH